MFVLCVPLVQEDANTGQEEEVVKVAELFEKRLCKLEGSFKTSARDISQTAGRSMDGGERESGGTFWV